MWWRVTVVDPVWGPGSEGEPEGYKRGVTLHSLERFKGESAEATVPQAF